jgi:hypothetical protein
MRKIREVPGKLHPGICNYTLAKKETMTDVFISATDSEDKVCSERFANRLANATPRRIFLRRSLAGAAIIVPTGLLAACGSSTGNTTNVAISATGQPTGPASQATGASTGQASTLVMQPTTSSKQAFTEIMNDEDQHVQYLQGALKSAARPKPTFQKLEQTDTQAFASMAQQLENVGVGAYLMAAPALTSKDTLLAAGSILTIEARHAGFLNALLQKPLSANGAFDKPMTQAEIVSAVSPFIANLNGGADPAAKLKNDEDILNFALLLEFLEAEFYKANVTKLFP